MLPVRSFLLLIPFSLLFSFGDLKSQAVIRMYGTEMQLYNMAIEDIQNERYTAAILKLLQSLAIDSFNRGAYLNLNYACNQTEQYYALVPYLQQAKRIFPDDDELYYYTGNTFRKIGELDSAINNYNSAIKYSKINGEDYPIVYAYYLNRGICFMQLARYEKAIVDFNYAAKLQENISSIYVNRAQAYFQFNKPKLACADWQKALELGESRVQTYIRKHCR